MASSSRGGKWASSKARAYASVCNNPGTSIGSYEKRLTASASRRAKSWKNRGSFARSTSGWSTRSAPPASRTRSAASVKTAFAGRRPCSTEATCSIE